MGIVRRFVDSGAKVLVADKVVGPAEKYISSLPENTRHSVSVMDVDLLDVEASDLMMSEIVRDFGGIDILVNNAGIYPTVPMLDMSPELFDKVYHLNLRALAFASKAAAKQMIKQKTRGKIVRYQDLGPGINESPYYSHANTHGPACNKGSFAHKGERVCSFHLYLHLQRLYVQTPFQYKTGIPNS